MAQIIDFPRQPTNWDVCRGYIEVGLLNRGATPAEVTEHMPRLRSMWDLVHYTFKFESQCVFPPPLTDEQLSAIKDYGQRCVQQAADMSRAPRTAVFCRIVELELELLLVRRAR